MCVRLLVAYDEEFKSIANGQYGYSPETLAYIFIWDAEGRFMLNFDIQFTIVEYSSWISNNSLVWSSDRLDEVNASTNFKSLRNSGYVDVLVAFTGQEMLDAYGIADRNMSAVLVAHCYDAWYWGQLTDNLVQHELTHLYNVHDHYYHISCVMSEFEWYKTEEWCDSCKSTVMANRENIGRPAVTGGGSWGVELNPASGVWTNKTV